MQSTRHQKRIAIIGAIALVLATSVAIAVYCAGRPWYRGRSIGFWFDGLNQQQRILRAKYMTKTPMSQSPAWGSPNVWVNLGNPNLLQEFEPFRRMGAEAVPFLLNVLEHPRPELDSRATLRKCLPQKFKWLAPFPKPPSEQQLLVLWVLGEIGPAAHGATSNILNYAEVPGLDYVAIDALRKIGVESELVMPVLCRSLIKQSELDTADIKKWLGPGHARREILWLFNSFGTNAQAAAPILIDEQERCMERLREINHHAMTKDWDVGYLGVEKVNLLYTVEAICRISPQDRHKTIPYLAKILRGEEFLTESTRLGLGETKTNPRRKLVYPSGRARAARCLSQIGSVEAVLVLKEFLKDDDADVSAAAREAVERAAKK